MNRSRRSPGNRSADTGSAGTGLLGSRSKWSGLVVVVLVGIYSLAAPYINDRFGLELPAIRTNSDGQVQVVDTEHRGGSARGTTADSERITEQRTERGTAAGGSETSSSPARQSTTPPVAKPTVSNQARGPLADRVRTPGSNSSPVETSQSASASKSSDRRPASPTPAGLYGILQEVTSDRYLSPAGLLYTPGSAEGHRLEHLKRHTVDDPSRPGSHGVFDGGMEGALKTIDRAYERAQQGQRTTKKVDDGRTIFTVDMGGRVGFVGGRDGNRKRNPMARRVRLVLDGNRVITAYPM